MCQKQTCYGKIKVYPLIIVQLFSKQALRVPDKTEKWFLSSKEPADDADGTFGKNSETRLDGIYHMIKNSLSRNFSYVTGKLIFNP